MTSLKIKNVVLSNQQYNYMEPGLEMLRTKLDKEINVSLTGTKAQINRYLQDAPLLSERLRTLKSVPKYRIINSHKVEIY